MLHLQVKIIHSLFFSVSDTPEVYNLLAWHFAGQVWLCLEGMMTKWITFYGLVVHFTSWRTTSSVSRKEIQRHACQPIWHAKLNKFPNNFLKPNQKVWCMLIISMSLYSSGKAGIFGFGKQDPSKAEDTQVPNVGEGANKALGQKSTPTSTSIGSARTNEVAKVAENPIEVSLCPSSPCKIMCSKSSTNEMLYPYFEINLQTTMKPHGWHKHHMHIIVQSKLAWVHRGNCVLSHTLHRSICSTNNMEYFLQAHSIA